VITSSVLLYTGPLVALLRPDDQHHHVCVEQSKDLLRTMITCWPVLTEAAWLLGDSRTLMQMLARGKLICLDLDERAPEWMDRYASQYATLRPQLADIALMYLAERERISHVFTLDRRDFNVYRTSAGAPLQLLPESL
jgi:predicted nucleic acid-binding protein